MIVLYRPLDAILVSEHRKRYISLIVTKRRLGDSATHREPYYPLVINGAA